MKYVVAFLLLLTFNLYAQSEITTDALKRHVTFLASDELKGRKPGTPEIQKAADYIAAHFNSLGLKALTNDSQQSFEIVTGIELADGNSLIGEDETFTIEDDFIPLGFTENGSKTAEIVFAGYGFSIENDSIKWNDYQDIDVKDKIVLILMGDPENNVHGGKYANYNKLRTKALTAKDNGAAAVIFVAGPEYEADDSLRRLAFDQSKSTAGIPVMQITRKVADKIFTDQTVKSLEEKINGSLKPAGFEIGKSVTVSAAVKKIETITHNIIAVIPGSDPQLKDEYIVVGAHYDHLGLGGWGSGSRSPDTVAIHNGADDNASGTSALLEVAANLANKNLKRSVLLMAFSAEEMGLLGSKYFTENPLVSLDQIRLMLNMDMVGRLSEDKKLTVGGTGTAIGLEDYVKEEAQLHGIEAKFSPEGYGPSDHASFYLKDIPVLFFFTGTHDDYHKPEDDTEKINFEGMQQISTLAVSLIEKQANEETELVFQEAGPKTQQTRMRFKVTLGIMPDYASEIKGLKLDGVKKDGPAFKAGILKGDVVVSMDGKAINNIYDYMARLGEFKPGQEIVVEVVRDGQKLAVDLKF